jgi:hypothetical protein
VPSSLGQNSTRHSPIDPTYLFPVIDKEIMSHLYLKKISLIGGGIALSIALSLFAEGLMRMNTPGAYVVSRVFPQSAGGHPDLRLVVLLFEGTDFLLCFVLLLAAYMLFSKLSTPRKIH